VPEVSTGVVDLRREAGWVGVPRRVVRAHGRDTVTYLQGQLSQDVAALPVGGSSPAFLLEPQGRIVVWLRVTRTADEEMVIDVDDGFVEPMLQRLERFKIRTDCTFDVLNWMVVAVRGPNVVRPPAGDGVAVAAAAGWPGIDGYDLLGPAPAPPTGAREATLDALEVLRVECGVPRMGAEIAEKTMPHELGRWVVDASVSFTKGCYTGQELVYRIDARGGNVPRHLRGVVIDGAETPPAVGAGLVVDGRGVGELTSVAVSTSLGAPVALALVHRSVEPPCEAEVDGTPCRIEPLPLVDR
jgi:folate-binding protein YgfZ